SVRTPRLWNQEAAMAVALVRPAGTFVVTVPKKSAPQARTWPSARSPTTCGQAAAMTTRFETPGGEFVWSSPANQLRTMPSLRRALALLQLVETSTRLLALEGGDAFVCAPHCTGVPSLRKAITS